MALLRLLGLTLLLALAPGCSLLLDTGELQPSGSADGVTSPDDGGGSTDTGTGDSGPGDGGGPDATPTEPTVVFPGSGSSCVLRYQQKLVTNCLETCPATGWKLTFALDGYDGTSSLAWRFTASTGYAVTPTTASAARPQVTLTFDGEGVDLCGPAGQSVDPASIFVELGVDGATPTSRGKVVATPLVSASCSAASDCPDPPQ